MKYILYLCASDISASSGPSINEYESIKALTAVSSDTVVVACPPIKNDLKENLECTFPRPYVLLKNKRKNVLFRQLQSALAAHKHLKKNRANTRYIVIRSTTLPIFYYLLLTVHRLPYFIKTLEDNRHLSERRGFFGWLARTVAQPLHDLLLKSLVSGASAVDTTSLASHKAITERLEKEPNRVEVIPNGVNSDNFKPVFNKPSIANKESKALIIGYCGSDPNNRGGLQVIKLVEHLKNIFPNLKAEIIGEPYNELLPLSEQIKSEVTILGARPYSEIPGHISRWDLGIAFDRPERIAYIGNSYQKLRQYISCGVPVLTWGEDASFIEKNKLGALAHPYSFDKQKEFATEWLSMPPAEKKSFMTRSHQYADHNLSTRKLALDRLRLWERSCRIFP